MFRQTQLPKNIPGRLLLHSMPGRYEPLDRVWAAIRQNQVGAIVRLADMPEIAAKSPSYASALEAGTVPCTVLVCEIPDYGVPRDPQAFWALAQTVASRLAAGESILVHCGAGIGRTGTFALTVLVALGENLPAARFAVNSAKSAPETQAQKELVDWCVSQKAPGKTVPPDTSRLTRN